MGVKDIEINIQLCWAEQAFTSTGLSEDANVLPEISTLKNAFYNQSCATRSTFAGNKKGRITGVHDVANIEFSWNWWYWPRMRPLLRCHLEIPKNCQISHGTSFNRNLTAVTRWKTEFLCRRPTEGAGRGSEPWHCHLIDPPLLNCTAQPAHHRVIWLSRKGRGSWPWRKWSQLGRLFTSVQAFLERSEVMFYSFRGRIRWEWQLVFKMVTMMAERCDRR